MSNIHNSFLFIRKGHVLEVFAKSLCVSDKHVKLVTFKDFHELSALLSKLGRRSNVIFYTPEWFILILIIKFWKRHCFFYFLHEPVLTLSRTPNLFFYTFYKVWLFCMRRCATMIYLSEFGSKLDNSSKDVALVIPLILDASDISMRLALKEPKSTDVIMWGSLNEEKGLDRFINTAVANKSLSFRVLGRRNDRLTEMQRRMSDIENISWDLRDEFITDEEIFRFVKSGRFAFLCQRESTQSAQLPLALSLGVPVLASDCGSFPEFLGENIYSKCFSNQLPDAEFALQVGRHVLTSLNDYAEAEQEALCIFDKRFNARSSIYANWSNQLVPFCD